MYMQLANYPLAFQQCYNNIIIIVHTVLYMYM